MRVLKLIIDCYLPDFSLREKIGSQCIEVMDCCPKIVFPVVTLKNVLKYTELYICHFI